MKKLIIGGLMVLAGLIAAVCNIVGEVRGYYAYQGSIEAHWNLADKSSTIKQKSVHIDAFVAALEAQGLQGSYNAVLFPNADNSFDTNLVALKTLQVRLQEIQAMNPSSFEYQTAMQQITAQEQGEATAMLEVFNGVWWKHRNVLLWDWVEIINWCFLMLVFLPVGGWLFIRGVDDVG